jgi:GNAT superfamily N-acetyltransferase
MLTYENDGAVFFQKPGQACIHVYVRDAFRRQGIGSRLVRMAEQAKEAETILNVYLYDNRDFFAPYIQTNNFQSVYGE